MFKGEFDPLNTKLSTSQNFIILCYICILQISLDFDTLIPTLTEPVFLDFSRKMNFSQETIFGQ